MTIQQMIDTIRQAQTPSGINADMLHSLVDNFERLIAYTDKLHEVMADMAKTTPAEVILELAEKHEIDVIEIIGYDYYWYNQDPDETHRLFMLGEASESHLAYVLGVDRLESRVAHQEWFKNQPKHRDVVTVSPEAKERLIEEFGLTERDFETVEAEEDHS